MPDSTPCAGQTDLFFSDDDADIARAKAICRGCTHRARCLETAFRRDERGIWGGFTAEERRRVVESDPAKIRRLSQIVSTNPGYLASPETAAQ